MTPNTKKQINKIFESYFYSNYGIISKILKESSSPGGAAQKDKRTKLISKVLGLPAEEAVKKLQSKLKELGFGKFLGTSGPNGDGIDGDYGSSTWRAVFEYQKDRKITTDGVVGPNTGVGLFQGMSQTQRSSQNTRTGVQPPDGPDTSVPAQRAAAAAKNRDAPGKIESETDERLKAFQTILGPEYKKILKATDVKGSYLHFDGRKLRFLSGGSVVGSWEATSGGGDAKATRGVPEVEDELNKLIKTKAGEITYEEFKNVFKNVAKEKGWDVDRNVTDDEARSRRGIKAGDIQMNTKYGSFNIKAGELESEIIGLIADEVRTGKEYAKVKRSQKQKESICRQSMKAYKEWKESGKIKPFAIWRIEDWLDNCTKPRQLHMNGNLWTPNGGKEGLWDKLPQWRRALKIHYIKRLKSRPKDLVKALAGPRLRAEFKKGVARSKNRMGRTNTIYSPTGTPVKSGVDLNFYEELKGIGPIPEGVYLLDVSRGKVGLETFGGASGRGSGGEWNPMDALGYMFARHQTGIYDPESRRIINDPAEIEKFKKSGKAYVPGLNSAESGAGEYKNFYGNTRHSRVAWGNNRISIINPKGATRSQIGRIGNLAQVYGRGSFYIHGGSNAGSSGCVDLGDDMIEFSKWYAVYTRKHRRALRLVVSYSQEMMTAIAMALGGDKKVLKQVFDKRSDVARSLAGQKAQRDVEKGSQF